MHWTAPPEKDTDNAALEKRLWDAAMITSTGVEIGSTGFVEKSADVYANMQGGAVATK